MSHNRRARQMKAYAVLKGLRLLRSEQNRIKREKASKISFVCHDYVIEPNMSVEINNRRVNFSEKPKDPDEVSYIFSANKQTDGSVLTLRVTKNRINTDKPSGIFYYPFEIPDVVRSLTSLDFYWKRPTT